MDQITTLKQPSDHENRFKAAKSFVMKLGSLLELLVILLIWIVIFQNNIQFGGYMRDEIITYLVGGSLVGLFSGWLLQRLISQDLRSEESKLLLYQPIRYLIYVLTHGWAHVILPFLVAVSFHVLVIIFFSKTFIINFDLVRFLIIGAMISLAFVIEFLLAYFIRLNVFWTFESPEFFHVLKRLKKILAGNYFPLTILPVLFVQISMFLPFAYSFFVPAQLYLNKITESQALMGLVIQIVWIVVLYWVIVIAWNRKRVRMAKLEEKR